ncbi:hypothetical protein F5876DRAFT_82264 [Lentinula aff. lateritia]|uniref:Uncharacterized protein n=1 Tax=Lentinula aff. lateritia TaxID=2804960 RepID=A0ACC1TK15_9AGAR|nr:hypothetical protein F5876DRAFT_82264 [Lentinula aff. lateritia]
MDSICQLVFSALCDLYTNLSPVAQRTKLEIYMALIRGPDMTSFMEMEAYSLMFAPLLTQIAKITEILRTLRKEMPAHVTETPKTNARFDGVFLEDEEDENDNEEKRAESSVGPLKFVENMPGEAAARARKNLKWDMDLRLAEGSRHFLKVLSEVDERLVALQKHVSAMHTGCDKADKQLQLSNEASKSHAQSPMLQAIACRTGEQHQRRATSNSPRDPPPHFDLDAGDHDDQDPPVNPDNNNPDNDDLDDDSGSLPHGEPGDPSGPGDPNG